MANQGLPLAAKYYTDEKFFPLDRDNIFFRSWQCVCHQSEVSNSGDFATLPIVDESIFSYSRQCRRTASLFTAFE
jgi:phenylpropionate dioxygenase-like ring-hydroxylating dioxygenase large terminal subunit